jgi:hypothetical protein
MHSGPARSMNSNEPEPPQPVQVHGLSGSMTTMEDSAAATTRRSGLDRHWLAAGSLGMTSRGYGQMRTAVGADG